MIKIPETIKKRKRIAELTNKEKVELNNFLIDFLRRHENELYQPKVLIDELDLKFLLSSFVTYLRASRQKWVY
jgi:hypothetical protein